MKPDSSAAEYEWQVYIAELNARTHAMEVLKKTPNCTIALALLIAFSTGSGSPRHYTHRIYAQKPGPYGPIIGPYGPIFKKM